METKLWSYINFTQLLVIVTFVRAMIYLPRNKPNRILLAILFVCISNEVVSLIFMLKNINNGLLTSVSMTLHNGLWLLLLNTLFDNKKTTLAIIYMFVGLAAANLFIGEGTVNFNYNTFIFGALLYLIVYIRESFRQLQSESFSFFEVNQFLLISAPVLFFLGLSFIFGFRDYRLSVTKVYADIHLYAFIGTIVNLVYYVLLNLYIHREKKLSYV